MLAMGWMIRICHERNDQPAQLGEIWVGFILEVSGRCMLPNSTK